jgi:hypothetical protein
MLFLTLLGKELQMRNALLAVILLVAAVTVAATAGGWWLFAAGAIGPDLALLAGAGRGLDRGQLHPRAVPLYNALHRFWWPAALAVLAVAWLGAPWLAGALAWATHVAIDRAVGYGLRTPDGFQRA